MNQSKIVVPVIKESKHELPSYATAGSAGLDLRANLAAPVVLAPGDRQLIPTGLRMALPGGYEAQVRPRSGLALKHGITVLNAPGTIDSDYRGPIGVILVNLSKEAFTIQDSERVAQLVIAPVQQLQFEQVEILEKTDRGHGGFGSTGKS